MMASIMVAVAGVVLQGAAPLQQSPCDVSLDAWLACNNPRVVTYLSELSREQVGTYLAGVELSDGTMALRDHRFVGQAVGLATGVQVFIFEHEGSRLAYVWVDVGASSLPLPECEGAFPVSAYVLSGDAYTWRAVQPGHGVVKVTCVDPQWKVKSSK
jgi:hypothetical protein